MSALKVRYNDEVVVLSGRDKGKKGKVMFVSYSMKKAIVTGINLKKMHKKPNPDKNQLGGIVEKEAFIDLSNISVFNAISNRSGRIGFRIKDGKKVRILKSNGMVLE